MPETNKSSLPKVLFLGQLPPPVHGVSLMNHYLINSEVIKGRFKIDVISLQFGNALHELAGFSIKKVFKAIGYGFQIIKNNLQTKPDVVYFTLVPTGFAFYRDAYYVFLLKLFRLKIVIHLHGKGIEENTRSSWIKKAFYTLVLRHTKIICLSKELATDITRVYKSKPFIVPNGIEVHPYFNREVEQKDNGVLRILCLSNYTRSKGILVLMDALAILKNKGYNFRARFVGAPFDLTVEFLEDYIRDNHLTGLAEITGPRNGGDKLIEYKNADIFVFPTYFEAFGLVNLEAMQYSLPVVSTLEGSIPEIVIDGKTGFLVAKQNAQLLAEKIGLLLDSRELRMTMGKNGYQRFIENYTLQHFESNINAVFQEVISAD